MRRLLVPIVLIPALAACQADAATPKTSLVKAARTASNLPGAKLTAANSRNVQVYGAKLTADKLAGYQLATNVTGPPSEAPPFSVTFRTSAPRIQVATTGSGSKWRVKVAGDTTAIQTLPADGAAYLIDVRLKGRKTRTVTVQFGNFARFGGVIVGRGETVKSAKLKLKTRLMVLGDSYTTGTGADAPFTGFAQTLGGKLGIDDVWASGNGQTGYLNPGQPNTGKKTIAERLASDVVPYKPDTLVIAAGINDAGRYPAADIGAAAGKVFTDAKAALPKSKIVVVGPWSPTATPTAALAATRDAIQSAASVAGVPFVDAFQFKFAAPDGTHPDQAGHDLIGAGLAHLIAG